jgi:hypothetical protein
MKMSIVKSFFFQKKKKNFRFQITWKETRF